MASTMSYDQSFGAALNKVENRFLLSVVLARRVTQLRKGAEPLVDSHGLATHEEIVYHEIIEDKLEWREANSQAESDEMEPEFGGSDFDEGE